MKGASIDDGIQDPRADLLPVPVEGHIRGGILNRQYPRVENHKDVKSPENHTASVNAQGHLKNFVHFSCRQRDAIHCSKVNVPSSRRQQITRDIADTCNNRSGGTTYAHLHAYIRVVVVQQYQLTGSAIDGQRRWQARVDNHKLNKAGEGSHAIHTEEGCELALVAQCH